MKSLMAFVLGAIGGWYLAHNSGWLRVVCALAAQGVNQ
jgi:hypothetical protein